MFLGKSVLFFATFERQNGDDDDDHCKIHVGAHFILRYESIIYKYLYTLTLTLTPSATCPE